LSEKKVKNFSQEIFESQILISFKQFLIRESLSDRVDSDIDSVRKEIKLTKGKILLKQLTRQLKILRDKEHSTDTKTGIIKESRHL